MADTRTLVVEITPKGIQKARSELKEFNKEVTQAGIASSKLDDNAKKSNSAIQKQSSAIKTLGRDMSRYFTLPTLAAAAASLKFANDLNSGLGNVQTLIPQTGVRIYELKEGIKELAATSGKSFEDLNSGLYRTISVFQDNADTVERLNVAVKAGIAGYASTEQAVALLSAVTRAYGDTSAKAVERVADLAFETVRLGDTTFPALSSAMMTATATANRLGVSQEQLFTIFATTTGVLGDATEVATKSRSAFASLLNPSKDMLALFEQMNVKDGKEFVQTMGGIQNALKAVVTYSDKTGLSLMKLLRRKEAIDLAVAIANPLYDDFNWKLEEINKSTGAMTKSFDAATTGVNKYGFQIKQSLAELRNFGAELGDYVQVELAAFLKILNQVLNGLKKLPFEMNAFAASTAAFLAVLGPVIILLGSLLKAFQTISVVLSAGGLLASLGGITAAFIGLPAVIIAATVALWGFNRALEAKRVKDYQNSIIESKNILEKSSGVFVSLANEVSNYNDKTLVEERRVTALKRLYPDLFKEVKNGVTTYGELADILDVIRIKEAEKAFSTQIAGLSEEMSKGSRLIQAYVDSAKELAVLEESVKKRVASGAISPQGGQVELELEKQYVEQYFNEYTKLIADVDEKVALINQSVTSMGLEFVRENGRIFFRLLDQSKSGVTGAIDEIEGVIEDGGGKAKKAWWDWFSELADIPLTRFDITIASLDDKGKEIVKILGYSGKAAAGAYGAEMDRLAQNTEYVAGRLGESFSAAFKVEQVEDSISKTKTLITSLMDIPAEMIRDEEVFREWDASIRGLTDRLVGLKAQLEGLQFAKITEEFAKNATELKQSFEFGNVDSFTFRQEQIDNVKAYRDELKKMGKDTSLIDMWIDAKQAALNFDVAVKDLGDSLGNLAVTELSTFFSSLGQAFGEGKNAAESMTDALVEYFKAILDALPMLLLNAGLHAITLGNYPLGLGLIAASASTSFLNGLRQGIENANTDASSGGGGEPVPGFAKGGAFTNTIVKEPTMFRFARGAGLMGEAGPEAILPLSRTSSGDLGVQVAGTGVASQPIVNISVNNTASDSVTTSTSQDANGNIEITVQKIMDRNIMNGKHDRVLGNRYGMKPQGIRSGA